MEAKSVLEIIIILTIDIGLAWAVANFAKRRGRNPYTWFFLWLLFGIFSLIVLYFLPDLSTEKKIEEPEKTDDHVMFPVIVEELPLPPEQLLRVKDWYCIDATTKAQLGPMNFDALKDLWNKEKVVPETYVWSEGMSEWLPVERVPNLEETLMK